MTSNLLSKEVEAKHKFLSLAISERTSAHVLTIDGGNIEASLSNFSALQNCIMFVL